MGFVSERPFWASGYSSTLSHGTRVQTLSVSILLLMQFLLVIDGRRRLVNEELLLTIVKRKRGRQR